MTENVRANERRAAYARPTRARAGGYALEADAIKALAHPKRLLILDLLSDGEERSVTDLVRGTGLSQSNLSQNLAVMRTAGVLNTRRDGHTVYYRVTDPRVVKALGLLRAVMADQARDQQFLLERAAWKKKERVKRTAALGAVFVAATLSVTATVAALHPLLTGGTLGDVGGHVQVMMASRDVSTLFQNCVNVVTEGAVPPAGPPMMA